MNEKLTDDCEHDCPNCGEAMVTEMKVDKAGNSWYTDGVIFCEYCGKIDKRSLCTKTGVEKSSSILKLKNGSKIIGIGNGDDSFEPWFKSTEKMSKKELEEQFGQFPTPTKKFGSTWGIDDLLSEPPTVPKGKPVKKSKIGWHGEIE